MLGLWRGRVAELADLGLEVGDGWRVAVGGAGPGLELLGAIALAVAGGCGFSHAGGMTADLRLLQPKAHRFADVVADKEGVRPR